MNEQQARKVVWFTTEMKTFIEDRFKEIVSNHLTPLLVHHGFKRVRSVFVRRLNGIDYLLDVQRSRWNAERELDFTVNCGVYIPGVVSRYLNKSEPLRPKLTDCCISSRVGMLTDEKRDIWWKLTESASDEADLRKEVKGLDHCIDQVVIPFLSQFERGQDAADFLLSASERYAQVFPMNEIQRLAYAAIILRQLGDGRAGEVLNLAVERSKGTPIEFVLLRLGKEMI